MHLRGLESNLLRRSSVGTEFSALAEWLAALAEGRARPMVAAAQNTRCVISVTAITDARALLL
jgi:hypothetical protein